MVPLLYCLRRGLGLKDGPGSARASTVSVWLRWWGSSSRHRPGQVLADLAPRAKVVQTVGCSTFTRGAKPATRRVADGERMNPQGKGWRVRADTKETSSTRATSTWRTVHAGARAPVPPCMAPVAPLFHPLPSYADAGRIFPAPARGEPRTPSLSRPRRGVPQTCHTPECSTASHGHSRAPTPPPTWSAIAAAHTADHATDLPSWSCQPRARTGRKPETSGGI